MVEDSNEYMVRTQAKENFEIEQFKNLSRIYSKKGCRECCERGYNLYDMIDKNNPKQKFMIHCGCVKNNMKKFGKSDN